MSIDDLLEMSGQTGGLDGLVESFFNEEMMKQLVDGLDNEGSYSLEGDRLRLGDSDMTIRFIDDDTVELESEDFIEAGLTKLTLRREG